MLSAFAEKTCIISSEMLLEIIGDLDFENHYWSSAAAGKESGHLADSVFSPAGKTQISFPPVSPAFVRNISQRIESVEKDIAPLHSSLKVHLDQLTALQHAFKSHVNKTDTQVADINKRSDKTMLIGGVTTAQSLPNDPAFNRIIQWIFGSNSNAK